MQARIIELIESVCESQCGHINIKSTLNHFIEYQALYEEKLRDQEWFTQVLTKKIIVDADEEQKSNSDNALLVSGWEVTVVVSILENLSTQNEKAQLNHVILDFYDIARDAKDKKYAILSFFKQAGIFSAMQYLICISLLTGGLDNAQIDIKIIATLLQNAELTWQDFIDSKVLISHLQLACEKDEAAIVKTVLNVNRFDLMSLSEETAYQESLLNYLFKNKKKLILKSVMNDLTAEEINSIKNLENKIDELDDAEINTIIFTKTSQEIIRKQKRKHIHINNLLNSMLRVCQKMTSCRFSNDDMLEYVNNFIYEIKKEISRPAYIVYDALYENYNALTAYINDWLKNNNSSFSLIRSSTINQPALFSFEIQPYHAREKKQLLMQLTNRMVRSLQVINQNKITLLDLFDEWLNAAVNYYPFDKTSRNCEYKINIKLTTYPNTFEDYLEIQRINLISYSLNLKSIPEFFFGLIISADDQVHFAKSFIFQQLHLFHFHLLKKFMNLFIQESQNALRMTNEMILSRGNLHKWGISNLSKMENINDSVGNVKAMILTQLEKIQTAVSSLENKNHMVKSITSKP